MIRGESWAPESHRESGRESSRKAAAAARACVYPGADDTFWLSDDRMAVRLRVRSADGAADCAAWLRQAQAAERDFATLATKRTATLDAAEAPVEMEQVVVLE